MNSGDIVGFRYSSEKVKGRVEYVELMVLSEDDDRIYGFRLNTGRIPERILQKIIKFISINMKKIDMKNAEKYSNITRKMTEQEQARDLFYNSTNRRLFNTLEKELVSDTSKQKIVTYLFRGISKKNVRSKFQDLNRKYHI